MNRCFWRRLVREDDGTTATEYAVMLALILVAVISAVNSVGNSTSAGWSKNVGAINSAVNGSGS